MAEAKNIAGATSAFVKGMKGEFMSLEEALTHQNSTLKLIDLRATGTRYDPITHRVAFTENGKKQVVDVSPNFKDYMARYGAQTHYITSGGTPWLTREQEQEVKDPEQIADYYKALASGENKDVVLLNWRKTEAKHRDTGHAALTIGHIQRSANADPNDPSPTYEFEHDLSGSFYPSTSPLFRPGQLILQPIAKKVPWLEKKMHHYSRNTDQHIQAAKDRHGDHPVAHSLGVTTRDALLPVGVASASIAAVGIAKKMFDLVTDRKPNSDAVDKAIKAMALFAVGYMTAKATGLLDAATGVVLLKEEERGSGMLASLITQEQLDIMEHTLYGMYKTYFHEYNILSSNCADFADKILHEIGLDTRAILDEAVAEEALQRGPLQKVVGKLAVPAEVRPSRTSFAFKNRKSNTGEVEIDGQKLAVSLVSVGAHSSVLVETDEHDHLFKNPPIETFKRVLREGLTLQQDQAGNYAFAFQPEVKRIQPTATAVAAGNAR